MGQDKLVSMIKSKNLDTFPRSVMLVGPEGSGKHTLCTLIGKQLSLPVENISDKLNIDTIEEIYTRVEPFVFLIDTKKITVKEQNAILKFIEEPLKNSFIVILAENKNRLLETIINRCQIWTLERYSDDILRQFLEGAVNSDLVLDIARTPGQVKKYSGVDLIDYINLAQKIVEKIDVASLPNTLTIVEKLSYKDEKDKLDCSILFSVLLRECREAVIKNEKPYACIMYELTDSFMNDLLIGNIDKKTLFENYLIRVWTAVRE